MEFCDGAKVTDLNYINQHNLSVNQVPHQIFAAEGYFGFFSAAQ